MGAWDWVTQFNNSGGTGGGGGYATDPTSGKQYYQDALGGLYSNENGSWVPFTGQLGNPYAYNPPSAPSAPSEEGGGGESIDIPTDLFSHSSSKSSQQSGLPDWGNTWAKSYLDTYSPQIGQGLSAAFTALENPVQLNDAQKAQLQYFTNENLRPTISNLGFRGVINSTTGKDAIAKVLATMGAKSYDEAIAQQQAKIAAYQKSQALLTAILEAARQSSGQSTSESSDPFEPWASMLPYLLGNPNE